MSEIYMKKEMFWVLEKKTETTKRILLMTILLIGLFIILLVLRFKSYNLELKKEDIVVHTSHNQTIAILHKVTTNELLVCKSYMEDYYINRYQKFLTTSLFYTCNPDSKEIEDYYNFHMNGKSGDFKFENDLIDDIKRLKNLSCFTSGKSYIALKTQYYPYCIEFKNFNIGNFYKSKHNDSNIHIKIYIYNVRVNKIHLHALKKMIVKESIIKKYTKITELQEYIDNVVIYTNKSDKYMRLCDILPNGTKIYENKFWFEISWNPEIQNMVCYETFKYIY
jgi:hypothetical protein